MKGMCLVHRVAMFAPFGPPALTVARSWHSMGLQVYLLSPESPGSRWAASSSLAGIQTIEPRLIGTEEGIDFILSFIRRTGAEALGAISDSHCLWLARNRSRFEDICRLLLPPAQVLESIFPKKNQLDYARLSGFQVLPTYFLRGESDIAEVNVEHFPLCLRPSDPRTVSPVFKVRVIESGEQWRVFFKELKLAAGEIIAQPFREGPNVVLHAARSEQGALLGVKAFLADKKFEGVTLRIREFSVPETLVQAVERFSAAARLSGPFHFDLLLDVKTGDIWFLEVNVRFGGTTDKVRLLGLDEAANCLAAYGLKGPRPARPCRVRQKAIVNKRAVLKQIVTALRRRPDLWDYPRRSRLMTVIDACRDLLCAKDSVFDWQDLKGGLAFHLQGLVSSRAR